MKIIEITEPESLNDVGYELKEMHEWCIKLLEHIEMLCENQEKLQEYMDSKSVTSTTTLR